MNMDGTEGTGAESPRSFQPTSPLNKSCRETAAAAAALRLAVRATLAKLQDYLTAFWVRVGELACLIIIGNHSHSVDICAFRGENS